FAPARADRAPGGAHSGPVAMKSGWRERRHDDRRARDDALQADRHPRFRRLERKTSVWLFAGIATRSASASPDRAAAAVTSARSRTPQRASRARRSASKAALLGAVWAPSIRKGP